MNTAQLYAERKRRYLMALRNEKPDKIPIRPFVAEFTAKYAGMTCQQVAHDYNLAFEAAVKCAKDFDWDAVVALSDRLDAIDGEHLQGEDALNRELLQYRLHIDLDGARFDEDRMPFTNDEGFFQTPAYMADGTRLRSAAEAEAYLQRLQALPAYYAQNIDNMRRGLRTGFVQPKIPATTASHTTAAQAAVPVNDDPLLAPLKALPDTLPAAQRGDFLARGQHIIQTAVKPAEQQLADFFAHEYLPKARDTLGAYALPEGRAYYAYRVRRETTTDLTPDQVFAIGESEIKRIRAAMDQVIASTGFDGSFQDFQHFLRTDPRFYVKTRQDLLDKAAWLAKRVDDQLPAYFGLLPRLPYGVREVPREIEEGYTTGRYFPGSPERGVAGGLMINTSHLDQRPLYELPALVAHEGAPGHHIQIAIAQEMKDVPQFRRDDGTTAYVEGWALYTEQLVGDMGLYKDPYDRFGQLSMEMWRACRLVMDVGIHWKGWSRDQAMACLQDNSALAEKNIENETDRYIAWPGQALGYKIGQLKISELRQRAEQALGPQFDIRAFHDVILDEGPMPLKILDQRVDQWIAAQSTS